ncbi:MAG TPA: hypothetical protein VKA74_11665 [Myxococcota bacterium]|nr:hypothetical protein [Myxococcota bacterium]
MQLGERFLTRLDFHDQIVGCDTKSPMRLEIESSVGIGHKRFRLVVVGLDGYAPARRRRHPRA